MDAHQPCPDSALLAAFLDGNLADDERTAVVSHLVECAECRAVAMTVVEFREVETLDGLWERPTPAPPPEPLFVGGVTRWSREKTRAPALIVAAAAAVAAVAIPVYFSVQFLIPAWSAQQAVSTLIDVAEEQRPVEARLSGASVYAPPPSEARRAAPDDRARIQLITAASNIRSAYEHDYGAPSRRAIGVAALLTGDLDDAIATLEIAVAAAPQDTRITNDLAAAYYERSQRANRPDDLPAALSAVERVLYQEPGNLEALFNRALIITALGLREEAVSAWQAYIERDSRSPWADEALERRRNVTPARNVRDWQALRAELESSQRPETREAAVRLHASATREYFENDLLKRWVAAVKRRDSSAELAALARMRLIADEFTRLASDNLYRDLLSNIAAASERGTKEQLVAAYEAYFAGAALMTQQKSADAAALLRRAQSLLADSGSPFRLRAAIELAASHYFDLRYKEAAAILAGVKKTAAERSYAILVTRSAWLEGMAAYGLNDFAHAQVAYEQMLSSAIAAGDVDQWVMGNVLLANLHEVLGDGTRAWQHRIDGAARLDEVFSRQTRFAFLLSAASDAFGGEHDGTAIMFQSIVLRADADVPASMRVQVTSQRARVLWREGRRAEAAREIAGARNLLAAVPNESSRLVVEADVLAAEIDLWLEERPDQARIAADRLLTLPLLEQDHLRRARAHQQLARVLVKSGDLTGAERAVKAGLDALDTFRDSPVAEFGVRSSDPVWQLYDTAAQIALARGDVGRAFVHSERGRLRTPQERRATEAVPDLVTIQRALSSDTAIVVFTQLQDRLQVFVVRRDDVVSHSVAVSSARAAVLVSRQLYEITRGAAAPQASSELFDLMFRPVFRSIEGIANVVVVADAPYSRIAYAGLWDRHRGRYVIEDHRVVVAPSAMAYASAARRTRPQTSAPAPRRASIIGAPDGPSGWTGSNLVASLRNAYGPDRLTRNDAATAKHLVEEVNERDVVHVAARAVANDAFPGLAHLEMGDEPGQRYSGAVFARSVAASQATRAQLVALETGARGSATSDAGASLAIARALLAAGVPTVVSPITDIDAQSVEQTWRDFHAHYAAGTSAAESLQRAQIAALSESDGHLGPWATLTVFGSAQ